MKMKCHNPFKIRKLGAVIVGIFILIICCVTLTACDPAPYYFEPEELSDIVSVELVNYDNPNQKGFWSWVPDHSSELKPFDDSKLSVLETLDEDKIPNFIDTLCVFEILYEYYAFDSPNKICLKLSYSNGDFLIINYDYIGRYTSDGEVAEFIGCFSAGICFKILVNVYFQTKI